MDQSSPTQSEVVSFAPKRKPREESAAVDEAGQAFVSLLREAVTISQDNALRAEQCPETIRQEIQEKLITPMKANRPAQPAAH